MDHPSARVVEAAKSDPDAIAVLLHGSAASGDPSARDIDLAVVLSSKHGVSPSDASWRYAEHSSGKRHEGLDVSVFQALPLYVRQRVLARHKILWVRDERALDELYEVAWRTVKEWEDFRPHYLAYLEEVARG